MLSFPSIATPSPNMRAHSIPELWPRPSEAPGWAMFIDLDGTLCPFSEDPRLVHLDAAQQELLTRLSLRLGGALCVLSGRSSDDLDRALGALVIPRFGEHGKGRQMSLSDEVQLELEVAEEAMGEVVSLIDHEGVWLERKATSCAIHYRRAPQLADSVIRATRAISECCSQLRVMEGNCLVELAVGGAGKGDALRQLMREAPFAGHLPVAVGDDVTDEDAFVAANELGGFGVCVGSRRSAAARFHLPDTDAVHRWLQSLAGPEPWVLHA